MSKSFISGPKCPEIVLDIKKEIMVNLLFVN